MSELNKHYLHTQIQPLDLIKEFKLSFALGNVIKYICRKDRKKQHDADIKKALWYMRYAASELHPEGSSRVLSSEEFVGNSFYLLDGDPITLHDRSSESGLVIFKTGGGGKIGFDKQEIENLINASRLWRRDVS